MAGRFLGMFRPLSRFLPEVRKPERRVGFNEKLFWTALALAVYFVMAEIPLYGIGAGGGWDLTALRVIFASNRGTLMELGIGPIVTAGLILQLLVGSQMIECNMSDPRDRALFTSASKAFTIIFTGVQASAYIIGGVYGQLAGTTSIIVFLQLLAAGVVVMLLDELVQKGWGIGSGISLFILGGVAQRIFWDCFAPTPSIDPTPPIGLSRGVFVALGQAIMNPNVPVVSFALTHDPETGSLIPAVTNAFIRARNYPAVLGFFATVAVFLAVIYAQGVRVELPMAYAGYRGFRSRYPIKLLYVSNLPVIFASALFANIYFFSQLLWTRFPQGQAPFWVNVFGVFEPQGGNGQLQPVGGLVYYVLAPRGILGVLDHPLQAFAYAVIMVAFCIVFSLTWLEVGGLGPSTIAQQLVDSGMQIPGYRRSRRPIEHLLKRYIPAVTILGGAIVGLLAAFSDFFGVFGSGTGILLAVGILYQYYQLLMQERIAEMYPGFRRLLGE
ncbi:MAG: preprotein translocase subunit SecY [Thermoproteota archaeon]|nr:preprotein translocase subunit SecY [Thermoproteota archaeon]